LNNHLIIESKEIPYAYPGNLEHPLMFQLSSIDKSITPVEILKSPITEEQLSMIYNAGEMWENSISAYLKDYKKRLIWKFPSVEDITPFDINRTSILNFNNECSKISISETQFHHDENMPLQFKSHLLRINKGLGEFYIRFHPKMNNFK